MKKLLPLLPVLAGLLCTAPAAAKDITLLNVSHDPTRDQSHGVSDKQARVLDQLYLAGK